MQFNPLDPFGSLVDWMISGAVDAWKQACKLALQSGSINGTEWQTVGSTTGHLAGVMLYVAIITGAVAVAREAFYGRVGGMFRAMCQTIFAWPFTLITIYLLMTANAFADQLTGKILGVDMSKPDQQFALPDISGDAVKGSLSAPLLIIILIILLLGSASIILSMAARKYLIIVGVCLICTVWVVITWRGVWERVKNYAGWLLGVILYQPVCALLISITGSLMKAGAADKPLTFVTAVVGMALASICPWVLIHKIVHFLPGPVANGAGAAASAGKDTTNAARSAAEKAMRIGTQVAGAFAGGAGGVAGAAGGAGAAGAGSMMPKVAPSSPVAGTGGSGSTPDGGAASSSASSTGSSASPAGSTVSGHGSLSSKIGAAVLGGSGLSGGMAGSRGLRAIANSVTRAISDSRGGNGSQSPQNYGFGSPSAPPSPVAPPNISGNGGGGSPAPGGPIETSEGKPVNGGGINTAPPAESPSSAGPTVVANSGGGKPDIHIHVAPEKGNET